MKNNTLTERFRAWIWILIPLCLSACADTAPPLIISDAVIREMAPGRDTGVAYLNIENLSKQTLTLNYVQSERTDTIEVHQHLYEDGVMKMRPLAHLMVAPGEKVVFSPGGFHLMLFGVDAPLKEGETLDLVFEFQNLEPVTVTATVKRL